MPEGSEQVRKVHGTWSSIINFYINSFFISLNSNKKYVGRKVTLYAFYN